MVTAEERLADLAKFKATPRMWAFTREAFLVHIEYAISELITTEQLWRFRIFAMGIKGNSIPIEMLTAEVTDEWAVKIIDEAQRLIAGNLSQETKDTHISDASQP